MICTEKSYKLENRLQKSSTLEKLASEIIPLFTRQANISRPHKISTQEFFYQLNQHLCNFESFYKGTVPTLLKFFPRYSNQNYAILNF